MFVCELSKNNKSFRSKNKTLGKQHLSTPRRVARRHPRALLTTAVSPSCPSGCSGSSQARVERTLDGMVKGRHSVQVRVGLWRCFIQGLRVRPFSHCSAAPRYQDSFPLQTIVARSLASLPRFVSLKVAAAAPQRAFRYLSSSSAITAIG